MKEHKPSDTKGTVSAQDQAAACWRRQSRATYFFKKLIVPWTRWKLNYTYEKIGLKEEPYILLANHNTDFDPILVNLAADGPVRFVASEHIMRKGLGTWFLKTFFQPIIFKKGSLGAATTLEMFRAIRRGEPVVLFPEGNRSFNGVTGHIPEVTGKLVKKSGAALVTYRLEGGYLTQPRWGVTVRKGQLNGRVIRIITPAELKTMTPAEITAIIREDLREDAYEAQNCKKIRYVGKTPALGMESALFCCPACKNFGTIVSKEKSVGCSCGWEAEIDDYGMLHVVKNSMMVESGSDEQNECETNGSEEKKDQKKTLHTIWTFTELDTLQREVLKQRIEDPVHENHNSESAEAQSLKENSPKEQPLVSDMNPPLEQPMVSDENPPIEQPLFSDEVTALKIGEDHQELQRLTGKLEAYRKHFRFRDRIITYSEIKGAAVHSRNGLTVHFGEEHDHYEIMGSRFWSALKYLYLYNLNEEREMF